MRGKPSHHIGAIIALLSGIYAHGDVLLDYSPQTVNAPQIYSAYNQWQGQHFLQPVSFAQDATVTGMAMYVVTSCYVGQPIVIDIYSNNVNNTPGSTVRLMQTTVGTIDSAGGVSGSNYVRAYADFTMPLSMTAGETLWFSMSGNGNSLGCYFYTVGQGPDGSSAWQFGVSGTNAQPGLKDMAMQVYGTFIPEPASLSLVAITACAAMRRYKY